METIERSPLFAEAVTRAEAPSIFERAVCVQLAISRLGTRRKVGTDAVKTDADADLVHVSADILQSKELDAIRTHDRDMAEYLRNRASGPAIFKGGVYMLALDLVEAVDAELQLRLTQREALVKTFLAVYEERKTTTEAKLGTLKDRIVWPDSARVARSFGAAVRYLQMDTPSSLAGIKREIFERERTKAAAEWATALDECKQVLRASFAELVAHLADRLTPADDGKKKVFRDSLVSNFADFAETFKARNIADDQELADLVERARGVMQGTTAKDLRDNEALRAAVARSMADLKTAIDPLVIDKPSRRYNDEE